MAIQNNDDQNEIDYYYQDFQHSVLDAGLDEPVPEVQDTGTNPLKGRRSPKRSKSADSLDEYKSVLFELNAKIAEICSDDELTSEQ